MENRNVVSLVVIVDSYEDKIERCIESAVRIAQEIVIVGENIKDNLKDVASKYAAKIYDYKQDFDSIENFAISKTNSDYSVILHSNEYLTDDSVDDIITFIRFEGVPASVIVSHSVDGDYDITEYNSVDLRVIPNGYKYQNPYKDALGSNRVSFTMYRESCIFIKSDKYLDTSVIDKELECSIEKDKDCMYEAYKIGKLYLYKKDYKKALEYFDKIILTKKVRNKRIHAELIVFTLMCAMKANDRTKVLTLIKSNKDIAIDIPEFNFICGLFFKELALTDESDREKYITNAQDYFVEAFKSHDCIIDIIEGASTYLPLYHMAKMYEEDDNLEMASAFYDAASTFDFGKAYDCLMKVLVKIRNAEWLSKE